MSNNYPPPPPPPQHAPQQGYAPPGHHPPAGYVPPPQGGYAPPPPQGYAQQQQHGGFGAPPAGFAPTAASGYGRAGVMSGLDDVEPTGSRLPHFNPGHRYLLENQKFEFFNGRKASFVSSEWLLLESTDPSLPVGRAAKWMIKWGQDMSLPNFKACLGALYGFSDPEEIKAQIGTREGELAISDAQPARGKRVELRTEAIKTRANTDFTIHNWSPVIAAGTAPHAPLPQEPYAPRIPAPQAAFPPPGWFPHQGVPGSFHNGKVTHTEAELRAMQATGRA